MKKIIMVTGATSGFGRAIALKFGANGYDVIITGRRKDRLLEVEKELKKIEGVNVISLNFDVRERNSVKSVIENLPSHWKNIDVLVNNAGLAAGLSHIDEGDIDDWDQMIDTNIKGLLYVTRTVAPLMVSRDKGLIINIGSIAGMDAYENGNVYCATKAAVAMLSRTMRVDMLKHNIKITNIAPGMVETEFSLVRYKGDREKANAVYNGIKPLTADDIADVAFYTASLPEHICLNEIVITPVQQASAFYNVRR